MRAFLYLCTRKNHFMIKDCIVSNYRSELKKRILEYSEKEFYANGVKQVKMDNELYKEFGMQYLFRDIVFTLVRGICTIKGIETIDQLLH